MHRKRGPDHATSCIGREDQANHVMHRERGHRPYHVMRREGQTTPRHAEREREDQAIIGSQEGVVNISDFKVKFDHC